MVNWLIVGIGIFCAVCAMIALIGISRDGYFIDFGINTMLQGLIVVSLCFAFWGAGIFRKELVWVAVVISFIGVFIGWCINNAPVWKWKAEDRQNQKVAQKLNQAIMGGRKYQAYSSFLKNNADSIGAISLRGKITYAPKGVSLFSKKDNGYEISYIWNPEIGHPIFYGEVNYSKKVYAWQEKSFFSIESGEREWTPGEKKEIRKIIEQTLPGGKSKWNYWYDEDSYYRILPATIKKKERKNPY